MIDVAEKPYSDLFKSLYGFFHIIGQRSFEHHFFPGYRVGKGKSRRMQGLTFDEVHIFASVEPVSEHRMTDMRHMHPDLMCPAGLQQQFHQSVRPLREAFAAPYSESQKERRHP